MHFYLNTRPYVLQVPYSKFDKMAAAEVKVIDLLRRMFGKDVGEMSDSTRKISRTFPPDVENNNVTYAATKFILEAEFGREKSLANLLKEGADVNMRDSYNRTALMMAAKYGFYKCVELLLKAGADVNIQDRGGRTALGHAARFKSEEEKGHPTGDGHRRIIKKLIKAYGVNVNTKSIQGSTLLMLGTVVGDEAVVKSLIFAGADVNAKGKSGMTALHTAVRTGRDACAEVLVQEGAGVNATWGKLNYTVLIEAVLNMNLPVECVEMLIDAGADANITDNRDVSALLAVALKTAGKAQVPGVLGRGFRCMQLLLKAGSPINKVDGNGWNAFFAIEERAFALQPQILILLLAAGEWTLPGEYEETVEYAGKNEPEMTLKNLCRVAVRNHMVEVRPHENLFMRVPKLKVFPNIESYLLYDVSLDDEYVEVVRELPNNLEVSESIKELMTRWKGIEMSERKEWEKRCNDNENS